MLHNNYLVTSSTPDNIYCGQVAYEVKQEHKNWTMHFFVSKHLNALIEVIFTDIICNISFI